MFKEKDEELERLFKTAKVMRPDVKYLEAGFESRVSDRLRGKIKEEASLSVWTWKLAPIMAVPLLILFLISAFMKLQVPYDIFNPIDTYDRAQINSYIMVKER